ncbi:UxaA family hydrolase [Marispirochaeta aestuarii]|uniref:UxaA family hydrolase n=1 Tax=Marispirochaeta aestuarii TaxID=1963862 RepID=UPI0029C6FFEC|nr:UxaA family hydrolase [Marispirochaeta aestuarii]
MNFSDAQFLGYHRPDGQVGVRNYLGVLSTVTCANQAAENIAGHVRGTAVFTHQQGCGLLQEDLDLTRRTLINLGRNPNLGAVLVVSLGCEGVDAEKIVEGIASSGKPVELVRIQRDGGYFAAISEGGLKAQKLASEISMQVRKEASIQNLRIGVKCGASDPTSGLASNPAVGQALDQLIAAGGSAVFGETTELIGAEHLVAGRCETDELSDRLLGMVRRLEARVIQHGSDMRGGNPSAGNIAAGLTTIEEKSLGAVVKSGTAQIHGVFDYGECPPNEGGLYFIDSPGREPELLAGLGAAGCQIILFSTGIGAPQGFPFIPVIKVSGNRNTVKALVDFIDLDVSQVLLKGESLESAGSRVLQYSLRTADGHTTKAETIGYNGSTAIYQRGPIV